MTMIESVRFEEPLARLRRLLPSGQMLPPHVWQARHNAVLALLWLHVPFLLVFGVLTGHSVWHASVDTLPIAICAVWASISQIDRRWRAVIATTGLLLSSTMLVHLAGGTTEMHFHFFVMLGVISLYQDWVPFLFSIGFVALQHGIMGVLDPDSVFNTPYAQAQPWLWATIHGVFVLAASAANLAAWKISERYTLHDALTDLPNRAVFRDRLEEALSGAVMRGSSMAVLYVDLDYFKAVNDTFGHDAGDQVLIEVGERLKACIRGSDTAARLGGDEFGVVLRGIADQAEAVRVAERIIETVSEPYQVGGSEAHIGASIGIAIGKGEALEPEEIVKFADDALYSAKVTRGTYVIHDIPMGVMVKGANAA